MLIAILASLVCLIIATILFTPLFRSSPVFRPFALFFLFQGVWIAVNYLIAQIWPTSSAMQYIQYAGVIVFGGYLIVCLFFSIPKRKSQEKNNRKNAKKRKVKR